MAFAGNLATLALPDVLTTLHNIRATGVLRLDARVGSRDIVFCDGRIEGVGRLDDHRSQGLERRIALLVEAPPKGSDDDTNRGRTRAAEGAVQQLGNLSAWGQGDFAFHTAEGGDADIQELVAHCQAHPLNLNTNQVLMEAARQQDEWTSLRLQIAKATGSFPAGASADPPRRPPTDPTAPALEPGRQKDEDSSVRRPPSEAIRLDPDDDEYHHADAAHPTDRADREPLVRTGRSHRATDRSEQATRRSREPTDRIEDGPGDPPQPAKPSTDRQPNATGRVSIATVNLDTLAKLAREHGAEIARRQAAEERLRQAEEERSQSAATLRNLQDELRKLYDRMDQRSEAAGHAVEPGMVTRRDLKRVVRQLRAIEQGLENAGSTMRGERPSGSRHAFGGGSGLYPSDARPDTPPHGSGQFPPQGGSGPFPPASGYQSSPTTPSLAPLGSGPIPGLTGPSPTLVAPPANPPALPAPTQAPYPAMYPPAFYPPAIGSPAYPVAAGPFPPTPYPAPAQGGGTARYGAAQPGTARHGGGTARHAAPGQGSGQQQASITGAFPSHTMPAVGALSGPHIAIPTKEVQRIPATPAGGVPSLPGGGSMLPAVASNPSAGMVPTVAPDRTAPPPAAKDKPPAWPMGRIIRLGIGAAFVLIALFAVALPMLFPISSVAVVNARVARITSPIDGTVSPVTIKEGALVLADQLLITVTNERVDTSRLDGLNANRQQLEAKRSNIESELKTRDRTLTSLRTELDTYRRHTIADLESSVASQDALLRKHEESSAARKVEVDRLAAMAQDAVAKRQIDEARTALTASERDREIQARAAERARSRLQAARAGVFIEGDQPPQVGRILDEQARIDELRNQLDGIAAQLEPLDRELASERERVSRLRTAKVTSPIGGLLWKREVTANQSVLQSALLFTVAERDSICIEAWFPQRHLDGLAPGDACRIHILNSGRQLNGTVTEIGSADPNRPDESLAIRQDPKDDRAFRVRIAIQDARARDELTIGQKAKVLITGDDSGLIRSLLLNLCAWMEF
ncbi:hypothetical protein LBMAG53_20650 [Planctomycetota bacterium]|nr:hypothetical protein LBMAG53_20650 [Planctomycetota bacterium]